MTASSPATPNRTERKRRAILDAATALFLANGFRGTSMDDIAATAGVSKQTVYKQFEGKEQLFRAIVDSSTVNAGVITDTIESAFGATTTHPAELRERLLRAARGYLDGVLNPRVLSLRRLVIAEADRFPDLAARYYERGPMQGIGVVARCLKPYRDNGLLPNIDPPNAARQFAYLVVGPSVDRALFFPSAPASAADRDEQASTAVSAFLAAYGARISTGPADRQ